LIDQCIRINMGDSNSNYDAPFHYIQRKIDDGPHEKMGAIQGSTYAPREVLILGRCSHFHNKTPPSSIAGRWVVHFAGRRGGEELLFPGWL